MYSSTIVQTEYDASNQFLKLDFTLFSITFCLSKFPLFPTLHTLKLPRSLSSMACQLVCVQRSNTRWSPESTSVLFCFQSGWPLVPSTPRHLPHTHFENAGAGSPSHQTVYFQGNSEAGLLIYFFISHDISSVHVHL